MGNKIYFRQREESYYPPSIETTIRASETIQQSSLTSIDPEVKNKLNKVVLV